MADNKSTYVLEVKDLCKYFPIKAGLFGRVVGQVHAVENVSFKLKRGTTMGLVVLPQPDSPTRPRISPAFTRNETPSTALTVPRSVLKEVTRSLTSSMVSAIDVAPYRVSGKPGVRTARPVAGGAAGQLVWGSSTSRSPSPKMFSPSTVAAVKMPG